jgi:probable addiction module antidote protein
LDSDEAVAQYLTAILKEDNPGLLAAALGDIARARAMGEIAKALKPVAQPRFDPIARVCRALGVRL